MIELMVFVSEAFTSPIQHQAVTPYDTQRLKCNSPQQIIMLSNAERFMVEQLALPFVASRIAASVARTLGEGVWPLRSAVQSTAGSPKRVDRHLSGES
jgi:hypothetical protein